jgi:hypothetical protein
MSWLTEPNSPGVRMRWPSVSRSLVVALLAGALSGCIAFGSFDKRVQTINRGVANAQNTALLMNVVRASLSEPLYFTSTSAVHGAGSEEFDISLPSFAIGPGQVDAQRNYTIGATNAVNSNTSTSFDVDVLGSKDFYAGMLTPLEPDDVNLLFSQGYSREMVLYLVVDRLKVTDVSALAPNQDDSHAPTAIYSNDPTNPTFPIFRTFVDQAMLHGLTTEILAPAEAAAPSAADQGKGGGGAFTGGTLNIVVSQAEKKDDAGPKARLCYDWALATETAKRDFTPDSPRCGAVAAEQAKSVVRGGSSVLPVKIGDKRYEIVVYTRSIFGVFKYLGGLVAHGQEAAVRLHHYPELASEQTTDGQLLDIARSGGDCFAQVSYRGGAYCIPNRGAENTKNIFNILNALLALKTSPGDLPAAQTVRITP